MLFVVLADGDTLTTCMYGRAREEVKAGDERR